MRKWLVVGLGNPGSFYAETGHNLGFRVIEKLCHRAGISLNTSEYQSLSGKGIVGGQEVILAKPLTFVNSSGQAVRLLLRGGKLGIEDIIIICDDSNLKLGQIRIRVKGSSGGHRGLESIIQEIGTHDFIRVRIGIGTPPTGVPLERYVLAKFKSTELARVEEAIVQAAETVELIIANGVSEAMNRYNRRD
jgi:PTH1 family peptidyl-tRNA hydrolase